jgi:tetraacyldisaccharide 4'-kinase
LATKLKQQGFHPAILIRGYHRTTAGMSDEQALLSEQLKDLNIPIQAQPDRVAGGLHILKSHPQTNLILLDDGFQHRRLARDIDIVLIDASNPLGYDHVHPRGLLRESPAGLSRASAIILTRCEQLNFNEINEITQQLRTYCTIPILHSRFIHTGLRSPTTPITATPDRTLASLQSQKLFATAAIANPAPFESTLGNPAHLWFPDHHDYTASDLSEIRRRATQVGATAIITTEKDWVKLRTLPSALEHSPPIWRLDLDIQFDNGDESKLLDLLGTRLHRP